MKESPYILMLLVMTFSCQNNAMEKAMNVGTLEVEEDKQTIFNEYKSDSLEIDLSCNNESWIVLLKIGSTRKEYDLNKLKIPVKGPPELLWKNSEYACIVTWWSQAQSRHVFIPTRLTNEFIYLDKDIEEMDSLNNNIVYIDTVTKKPDMVSFKVENLLTRKNKTVVFSIKRYNGNYPFYDEIILSKDKLTISTAYEKKSLGIKDISVD